jgi:hypothetical protein
MGEKAEKLHEINASPAETPSYIAHDLAEAVDWSLNKLN